MTTTALYVLAMAFTDWDACIDYAAAHNIEQPDHYCVVVEVEQPPIRPRMRPWPDQPQPEGTTE